MRKIISDFVTVCAAFLPYDGPVYEFGSLQLPGQLGEADLRPYFQGIKYVGCDMRPGPGVDELMNLHRIDLPENTAGLVLCMDTLQHVEEPSTAVIEMHRVLKPKGILIISTVLISPIFPCPADYWRFTPEALELLLAPFDRVIVDIAGDPHFPHTVVGIGFKGAFSDNELQAFTDYLVLWKEHAYLNR
ncbi:class I SAM-dependent methyltransferase [Paenibacillus contaminans]|uniref:Methyltransferase type 11 n=1 Tax=Paenibacillus contaminans TaxID=450362 RepID=A0A329MSI8_9BACL|nr:class I SAM-dependent methyltransferase [Paenibacillus contaminans]RAV22510.1 methyltransferase type 11 [Paenibacillus contaminans]